MPKVIKQAIAKYKDCKWTVRQLATDARACEQYCVDGKPVFMLSWWSFSSAPNWHVY